MLGDAMTAPADTDLPAPLRVLHVRRQFLALNRARRVPAGSFLLQARDRNDDEPHIGVGFTCSKKVGNAVARNRAKRRLRDVARHVLPTDGRRGWDYALIGRAGATAARPYPDLLEDLRQALLRLHA